MTPRLRSWSFTVCLVALGCESAARASGPVTANGTETGCASAALGVETTNASRALVRRHHLPAGLRAALVTEVLPESPAARAGILAGDAIERVGGADVGDACAFEAAVAALRCGEAAPLAIRRGELRIAREVLAVDAVRLYQPACGRGDATACFRLGGLAASGLGTPKDADRAEALYEGACEAGSGAACTALGRRLEGKRGLEARRRALLVRACERHDANGCVDLAWLHVTGSGGAERDARKATALYVLGCEGGHPGGCFNAALNHEAGWGVAANAKAAAAYYEEGCDGGSTRACTNLGLLYDEGRGVERSFEKAAELYGRGCRASACESSNLLGCVNLGRLYRDGRGVAPDPVRAAALFREACERPTDSRDTDEAANAARACSLLGAAYANGSGVPEDGARALALSTKGCDAGDPFGCFNLGVFRANGVGGPADLHAAAMAFRRACDGDDAESCYRLGVLYGSGRGVERNDATAAALLEKACQGGYESACAPPAKPRR